MNGPLVPLNLEYRLGRDDYAALYSHVWDATCRPTPASAEGFRGFIWRHVLHHMIALVIVAIGFIGFVLWHGKLNGFVLQFIVLPFSAVAVAFVVLIWFLQTGAGRHGKARWLNTLLRKHFTGGRIHLDCDFRVTFDTDLITERWQAPGRPGSRGEEQMTWREVSDVGITERHTIFSIGSRGYLIVPRVAFGNVDDFARFLELVRSRWPSANLR